LKSPIETARRWRRQIGISGSIENGSLESLGSGGEDSALGSGSIENGSLESLGSGCEGGALDSGSIESGSLESLGSDGEGGLNSQSHCLPEGRGRMWAGFSKQDPEVSRWLNSLESLGSGGEGCRNSHLKRVDLRRSVD